MDTGQDKKSTLNRIYFAKLHEKVHTKYEEMQRKLDKYKQNQTNDDQRHSKEIVNVSKNTDDLITRKDLEAQNLVIQEVAKQEAICREIGPLVKRESDLSLLNIEDDGSDTAIQPSSDYFAFVNNPLNVSLESLNDEVDKYDSLTESPLTPTKQPKQRLRHKIGSRITAAMEKRQREKEKQEYKRKVHDLSSSMETLILSNTTKGDLHRMGRRARTATLTIALIEVKGLDAVVSEDKSNAFYCRFRLGGEKCKSKFAKIADNDIKWLEMFNVPVHDEYMLEVTLWDKENQDSLLGRAVIDTSDLQKERTHEIRINLDGATQNVEIFMLLTISGTALNTIIDMDDYKNTEKQMKLMKRNFAWYHLADDYRDVGCLSVLVYGAKGLAGNDPFCVLELGNTRLQTDTEYKTFDPNWMKIFVFTVTDITSILVVSVYDENKNKAEILGKISIPLLQIRNEEKKWYALKDKTQRKWANGDYPRILLEMRVTWNPIKAAIRVVNPKEQIYMRAESKLSRQIFARNIYRSRVIISWLTDAITVIKECFEWESKTYSFIALLIWLTMCWIFEVWMLPALILVPFVWKSEETNGPDVTSEDTPEKEDKWSIRETLQNFQELTLIVQNGIGTFASLGESLKNLVNFTVPYLSWLAIVILVTIAIVMYLIPVKYIFMAWAINKFTRKMLRPNRIPNNEILDLLSRVPDDEVLMDCQELPLDEIEDPRVSN